MRGEILSRAQTNQIGDHAHQVDQYEYSIESENRLKSGYARVKSDNILAIDIGGSEPLSPPSPHHPIRTGS